MNDIVIMNNWEKAKYAIEQCRTLDEVKDIKDKASALAAYAKQAKESLEVQNNISEIKLRAERKIGEFSRELPTAKNQYDNSCSNHDGESNTKTYVLKSAGIDPAHASRYESIAAIPQEQFEEHIQETKTSGKELTTAGTLRVAQQVQREQRHEEAVSRPLPTDKYRIIYADPPWNYGNSGLDEYGHAERHYPTMTIAELCEMPIKDIAEDDSVLFMWVTSPMLKDAFPVIKSWGFEYKTSFVWDKVKHNYGYYNSVRHEFLLVCTRGSCLPDIKDKHDSVISIERSDKHSEKPEYFRKLIDSLYLSGNRIELFAREKVDGWDCYGNDPVL